MTDTTTPLIAAADGSALRNPVGPAAWCWFVDSECWAAGGWKSGTNNIAELTAILELLRATRHIAQPLLIQSDSKYAINCVTEWIGGWKRKGWKTAAGKDVKNADLIREIDTELQGRLVTFEWIKGHAGHPRQEAADTGARNFTEAIDSGATPDPGPGWTKGGDAPKAAPATGTSSAGASTIRSAPRPAAPTPATEAPAQLGLFASE